MRKFFSILLLSAFLFNIGGYYIWFKIAQYNNQKEIKKEIRKGLKNKDLTLIIISANNESSLHWIKPKKEFQHQGEMYDVVKTKLVNKHRYYYCINDKKEKQLTLDFSNKSKHSGKSKRLLKKITSNNYFPPLLAILTYFNSQQFSYYYSLINYNSKIKEILSPPPNQTSFI